MQQECATLPTRDDGTGQPEDGPWKFRWLANPEWAGDSMVTAFRLRVSLDSELDAVFRFTGDQRYALHLDGARIASGPERGTHKTWFLQGRSLRLAKGNHVFVAIVSWQPVRDSLSHHGHIGLSPGFALHAEGLDPKLFNTGHAPWEYICVSGYSFRAASLFEGAICFVGARTELDMRLQSAGVAEGADEAGEWRPAAVGEATRTLAFGPVNAVTQRMLHAGMLPPMYEREIGFGKVRHAISAGCAAAEIRALPFLEATHEAGLADSFQGILDGAGAAVLDPGRTYRFLIEVGDYVCAWPLAEVSGGRRARVGIEWAESLFRGLERGSRKKDRRDQVEGKFFLGFGDSFVADGSAVPRKFEPLWWEAGRFAMVTVETADEALAIHSLRLRETHYPYEFGSSFNCDDARWDDMLRMCRRTLEMCSHETYFDCPYYEQLMYGGDARIEMLCSYANALDDRLAKKAIYLFDRSRDDSGLPGAVTPCITDDCIPPFALWWVMAVRDYAWWRDDMEFVRARMPGVRATLEAYRAHIGANGLLRTPPGWNFTDWVQSGLWTHGVPPDGPDGTNATLNFQLALTLKAGAELEGMFGESHLEARNRETASAIVQTAVEAYWIPDKALFAENLARDCFSEHTQSLAILCGGLPAGVAPDLGACLRGGTMVKTTPYFDHYLFEALREQGMTDVFFRRIGRWFEFLEKGLVTTVEFDELPRSDCHAWSAHPMYHAYATVAGIRPSAPGFRSVSIAPQFGPLARISARMVHPGGVVSVQLERAADGVCTGRLEVPAGIGATAELPDGRRLVWNGGVMEVGGR